MHCKLKNHIRCLSKRDQIQYIEIHVTSRGWLVGEGLRPESVLLSVSLEGKRICIPLVLELGVSDPLPQLVLQTPLFFELCMALTWNLFLPINVPWDLSVLVLHSAIMKIMLHIRMEVPGKVRYIICLLCYLLDELWPGWPSLPYI